MGIMNRITTAANSYQGGEYKRVLCVCSAGCLRSPTAAVVLAAEPFNFNTRAAGIDNDFAIIAVDEVLVRWADCIVVMEPSHRHQLERRFGSLIKDMNIEVVVLHIQDSYEYRDPELMNLIKQAYMAETGFGSTEPRGEIVPEKNDVLMN